MLSHEEMIGLNAEKHKLISTHSFRSKEEYVLHLIHEFTYIQAERLAHNKKILDLGCNTGYGTMILSKSAKSIVGVDVSEKAILTAKKQYGYSGIEFQLVDGKKLPFEDNKFDMIVSFQVIEHIVDYKVYIDELKRVLSPKGIVVFTTPNALLRLDPGMKPWNKFHIREFNSYEFETMLSNFFPDFKIFGLFAKEPLYSIEVNRLKRARKRARDKEQKIEKEKSNDTIKDPQFSLISLMKAVLPGRLKILVRNMKKKKPLGEKKIMMKYGLEDFFYLTEGLEASLDLMAICSYEKDSLESVL